MHMVPILISKFCFKSFFVHDFIRKFWLLKKPQNLKVDELLFSEGINIFWIHVNIPSQN